MELGLSLGNASKQQQQQNQKTTITKSFDLCMALGLNSSSSVNEAYQEEDDDDDDYQTSDNDNEIEAPFQLDLLPRRHSSDYGSSENGSSGNIGDGNILCGNKRDLNDVVEAVRTSDDDYDENGVSGRKKLRLSKEQSVYLEESFKEHNTLNPKQKQALARQLNLRPRQVEVWFQNRRARTKLKQTEVDCEYLKRYCETLTDENQRLRKELQDLRALKASNPFHMQLPATTLTMCPSCERVATTTAAAAPPAAARKTDLIPFPLTRPRFYPFSQNPTRPNH